MWWLYVAILKISVIFKIQYKTILLSYAFVVSTHLHFNLSSNEVSSRIRCSVCSVHTMNEHALLSTEYSWAQRLKHACLDATLITGTKSFCSVF